MLLNLSQREKKMLLFLTFFLLFTIFIQLMIKFILPTYASIKLTWQEKQRELADAHSLVNELGQLNRQRAELNSQLDNLLARFQFCLEASSLLAYLEHEDLDLRLDNLSFYPIKNTEYYSTMQIDIKVSGSYPSILAYLERLEKVTTVVEIVSPNITVKEKGQVSCEFTLNIYSLDTASVLSAEVIKELGKLDIFTPPVQVLTPIDVATNTEPEVSKVGEDSITQQETESDYIVNTKQEKLEVAKPQVENINYNFPSR